MICFAYRGRVSEPENYICMEVSDVITTPHVGDVGYIIAVIHSNVS